MHETITLPERRAITVVKKILDSLGEKASPAQFDLPRPLIVDVVRQELTQIRRQRQIPDFAAIVDLVQASLERLRASRIQPVINGTGVVIHTNLGRSPLPQGAGETLRNTASSYNNLELDLTAGDRGGRGVYLERALALLCQTEAATIVNNCAAALVLIVRHFTRTKLDRFKRSSLRRDKPEVVTSRGELVQIGGGFRIGEILEASGVKLREVGATNKTTLEDYAHAIGPETAIILKVHRSNFFMSGFVESPSSKEISALARKKRIAFVEDLGSGAMFATESLGIAEHEPTAAEVLKAGADVVCFSGDKLFGGPQSGIIVGKKRFITALKREPLFRALRCDKLCFAALQTTVDLHLDQKIGEMPTIAVLKISDDALRARAVAISSSLQGLPAIIGIGRGRAKAGGGTLPSSNVSSVTIDIIPRNSSVAEFAATLRASDPPVIGY